MGREDLIRAAWLPAFAAAALLLLFAGGLALQHASGMQGLSGHGAVARADHAQPGGFPVPASAETLESEETAPVEVERLNALSLCLFLVSLGLLLGVGRAGRGAELRRLDRLRLPAVVPRLPTGHPLPLLEVFRI